MLRRYSSLVNLLNRVTDATTVTLAWLVSFPLLYALESSGTGDQSLPNLESSATVAVIWIGVFGAHGLYASRRIMSLRSELSKLLRAHSTALLLFLSVAYLLWDEQPHRSAVVTFALTSTSALCALRIALRKVVRSARRRGYNQRRALIIGNAQAAHDIVVKFKSFPELGIQVAGAVTSSGSPDDLVADEPVTGDLSQARQIIRERDILDVVIALPADEQHHLNSILRDLKNEQVTVRLIPDVSAYASIGCSSEDFNGLPLVHINESPMDGVTSAAKRTVDLLGALTAFLIFGPVMLAVAIAVKLTSKGPLLYGQERMGLDGRRFKMYKFRSMKVDAEVSQGAQWAKKDDDRRTPIGAFIRRTSLDELPQLWNVLRGDMSLVGPRPERPVFVEKFRDEIPQYMLRHKVKSGMTGWAQVNGWRGDTSLEHRIQADIFYIRNWSLLLDLRILWMTVFKGFVNENAY